MMYYNSWNSYPTLYEMCAGYFSVLCLTYYIEDARERGLRFAASYPEILESLRIYSCCYK